MFFNYLFFLDDTTSFLEHEATAHSLRFKINASDKKIIAAILSRRPREQPFLANCYEREIMLAAIHASGRKDCTLGHIVTWLKIQRHNIWSRIKRRVARNGMPASKGGRPKKIQQEPQPATTAAQPSTELNSQELVDSYEHKKFDYHIILQ